MSPVGGRFEGIRLMKIAPFDVLDRFDSCPGWAPPDR
jgi:hypothetical protein